MNHKRTPSLPTPYDCHPQLIPAIRYSNRPERPEVGEYVARLTSIANGNYATSGVSGAAGTQIAIRQPTRKTSAGRLSGKGGYSFIEMLIVFALLAILLAVTVVSMSPSVRRSKVRNAANIVAGDLQYAQVLAARHRRPVSVIVTPSTLQYIIRARDTTTIYRTRHLGNDSQFNLDLFTVDNGSNSVDLYPNGAARQTTTFTVSLNGYQRQVRITRAGQIRILR